MNKQILFCFLLFLNVTTLFGNSKWISKTEKKILSKKDVLNFVLEEYCEINEKGEILYDDGVYY